MANPIESLPQPLSLPPRLILQRCRRAHQYQSSLSSTEAQEGYGIRRDPVSAFPSHLQHDREQCFNMHRRLRGRDHVSQYKKWGGSWHIVLNGALVGLYFTSLLTSLNARHRFATERTLVRHFGTNMLHSGTLSGRVPDMTSGPEETTRDAQYQRSGTSRTGRERSSTSTSSGATVSLFRALTGPRRPSAAVIMEEGRPLPSGPTLIVTQASIVEQIRLEKSEKGSRQEQLERRGSL